MARSNRNTPSAPVGTDIKVVASKSCPSLSGKSTISYKLGLDPNGNLHVRLHENSGGGFFNNDWYPAQAIVDLLLALGKVESLTSRTIAPLSQGRSANTPAFLAAVLRNEGVLLPYKRTSRYHVIGDLDAFLQQGGESAVSIPRKKKASKKISPRKTTKKTPVKKG